MLEDGINMDGHPLVGNGCDGPSVLIQWRYDSIMTIIKARHSTWISCLLYIHVSRSLRHLSKSINPELPQMIVNPLMLYQAEVALVQQLISGKEQLQTNVEGDFLLQLFICAVSTHFKHSPI